MGECLLPRDADRILRHPTSPPVDGLDVTPPGENGAMFDKLGNVARVLRLLSIKLDPATYSPEQAAAAIKALVVIEKLAAGMRLRLSARIDTGGLFGQDGESSAARWLGKATGQSPADA